MTDVPNIGPPRRRWLNADDVAAILAEAIGQQWGGQSAWARKHEVSKHFLNDADRLICYF